VPEDRILVVVQLGGGNDGLNTVIPYGDRAYYNARPQLGVPDDQVIKFTERQAAGIGLHPNLELESVPHEHHMLKVIREICDEAP
jgi:uncharacterized protein (DUF1501 family)